MSRTRAPRSHSGFAVALNIVAFTARLSKHCGEFDHKRRAAHRRLADEHRVRPGAARPPAIFGRLPPTAPHQGATRTFRAVGALRSGRWPSRCRGPGQRSRGLSGCGSSQVPAKPLHRRFPAPPLCSGAGRGCGPPRSPRGPRAARTALQGRPRARSKPRRASPGSRERTIRSSLDRSSRGRSRRATRNATAPSAHSPQPSRED